MKDNIFSIKLPRRILQPKPSDKLNHGTTLEQYITSHSSIHNLMYFLKSNKDTYKTKLSLSNKPQDEKYANEIKIKKQNLQ